jgi:predicted transposase YbfD/YdcC
MEKGFARVVNQPKSSPTISRPRPIDLQDLQMGLSTYFDDLPDPRVDRTKQHLLKDILVITILATIAGAVGWEDIENYGLSKQQWLEEFLELPNGIPSDDTFRRVFERLDPKVLELKLSQWLQQIMGSVFQEIIPIDGKSLRGSYDREKGLKNLHLVTAWAIVIVERVRHLWNKITHEVQFYLSSLPVDAQLNGRAIRQHWGIENQVHWSLDVTFNEDKSRIRSLNSPQNFALVRRLALNAVNTETTLQRSLRQKIKRAAMNNDYMMQILKCFCQA